MAPATLRPKESSPRIQNRALRCSAVPGFTSLPIRLQQPSHLHSRPGIALYLCGKVCGKLPRKLQNTAYLRAFSILVHGGHRWTLLACLTTGEYELDNPEKIIRLQAVKVRCGLSRSTLYNRMAVGEFPSPVALGARAVGWVESEVNAWIAARINASRKCNESSRSKAA